MKHKRNSFNILNESDILYQNGDYWVRKHEKGWYEVYRVGITHSTLCATIGYKGEEGLIRAKEECDKRVESNQQVYRT